MAPVAHGVWHAHLSGREVARIVTDEDEGFYVAAVFQRLGAELEAERKLALHLWTKLPRLGP
jgi:hypothetical protein